MNGLLFKHHAVYNIQHPRILQQKFGFVVEYQRRGLGPGIERPQHQKKDQRCLNK